LCMFQDALLELDSKIRMLRLEVSELSRDLTLTRKLLPSMPHLAESILDLQKALALEKKVCSAPVLQLLVGCCRVAALHAERCCWERYVCVASTCGPPQKTEKLCSELETPDNADRCVSSCPLAMYSTLDCEAPPLWRVRMSRQVARPGW
jgi:hypothetical protein